MRILPPVLAAIIGCLAPTVSASAQDAGIEAAGAAEFRNSCVVCHGNDARGTGPMAEVLKVKPADLTALSKNNRGEFPFRKVLDVIDGSSVVTGHGNREMPAWGDRFQFQAGAKYGPYGSETVVRARILELVYYLQSIQKP